MKKTKNVEWIMNQHLKRVSENIGMDIELLHYDLRNIEDLQELKNQLLCFIEDDIKKDIEFYKNNRTYIINPDIHKVALIIRTFKGGKRINVNFFLK